MTREHGLADIEYQDRQFAYQNGLIHRKPPILVEAPALTWYLGFWKPFGLSSRDWTLAVDTIAFCAFNMLRRLDANAISPNLDKSGVFFGFNNKFGESPDRHEPISGFRNYETVQATVSIGNFVLRVQAEMAKEFWTVCFACSYNAVGSAPDELQELDNKFSQMIASARSKDGSDAGSVHGSFTAFVMKHIIEPARAQMNRANIGPGTASKIGGKFADFRGIVLHKDPQQSTSGSSRQIPPATKLPEWKIVLDELWPLVKSLRLRHERGAMKPEYTVSRFQGSQALYISSLGATSPVEGDLPRPRADPELSVRYMVVVAYRSKWMLGRLLDRLHRAGTMRIAAVRDLRGVDKANRKLNDIHFDASKLDEKTAQSLHRKLLNIRAGIDVGLEFRAYRSKYYLKQFKMLVKGLRIQRVPGFQPYDEFVFRRMHSNFETISSTYGRYMEIRREIDVIFQKIQAERALNYQATMQNLMKRAEVLVLMTLVYYSGVIYGEVLLNLGVAHYKLVGFLVGMITALVLARYWNVAEAERSTDDSGENSDRSS